MIGLTFIDNAKVALYFGLEIFLTFVNATPQSQSLAHRNGRT